MGLFTKDIHTLADLFAHQLKDVYYAEHRITKALPKMIAKATSPSLQQGFKTHLDETENQIKRLDDVFAMLGMKAESVTCPAIDGIIKEAEEVAGDIDDKDVLDAGLVAAAQAVEHYENRPLRNPDRLGETIGTRRSGGPVREDPRRGKGDRQDLDGTGQHVGQSKGRMRHPQA